MNPSVVLLPFLIAVTSPHLLAEPFYVDPAKGDDTGAGSKDAPFKTIARAMKEVDGVGGEIDLAPGATFAEEIRIAKGGTPTNPLVIDGHGAVINLGTDITKGPWTDTGKGFRLERPVVVQIRTNLVTVCWVNGLPLFSDDPRGKRPQAWHGGTANFDADGHLVVVFPKGLSPANSVVVLNGGPTGFMSCGVNGPGNGGYVQIRNLTSCFSSNDGFNFHGHAHDVQIDNVKGLFNGDQGTSAHEDYHVDVQNSEYAFNGSGDGAIEDAMEAVTNYKNVRAHQNRSFAFMFMQGHHILDHVVSFENGTSNLPKPGPHIAITDSQDLGQIGGDKEIPVVADPNAPLDPSKPVAETDRLGRFLQLRPAPGASFPVIQAPPPKVATSAAPAPAPDSTPSSSTTSSSTPSP